MPYFGKKGTTVLRLHGLPLSNYTNVIKQFLLEKGVEFEQTMARPSQEEDFLAISPMGKIPCLETHDGFLIETSVILDYLDELYPGSPTYPAGAFAKAKAREIMRVSEQYIELVARRHLAAAFFGGERSDTAYEEVRPQIEKGLRAFAQLAKFGPYVMGNEFSTADIVVYHAFRLASQILARIYDWDIMAEVPGLTEHAAAMEGRAVTQQINAENEAAIAALMARLKSES